MKNEDVLEKMRQKVKQVRSETETKTRWDIADELLTLIQELSDHPEQLLCDDDRDFLVSVSRGQPRCW